MFEMNKKTIIDDDAGVRNNRTTRLAFFIDVSVARIGCIGLNWQNHSVECHICTYICLLERSVHSGTCMLTWKRAMHSMYSSAWVVQARCQCITRAYVRRITLIRREMDLYALCIICLRLWNTLRMEGALWAPNNSVECRKIYIK